MSDTCVGAEKLSKKFNIIKRRLTLFRALKAVFGGVSFKRELRVLDNISFDIKKGERFAIVGKNGSGKTTLLRILAGIYEENSGRLYMSEQPKVMFNLSIGINLFLSVIDNIYLLGALHGISRKDIEGDVPNILKMAELEDLKYEFVRRISRGQQQRLVLSVFLHAPGNFFVFDESITFVDLSFRRIFEEHLEKLFARNATVILVSHDLEFLRKYCDKAMWLEDGKIRSFGNAGDVVGEYENHSA